MKKGKDKLKIFGILLVVIVFCLIMSIITININKKDNDQNNTSTLDYKALLKQYYESNSETWNDEVTVLVVDDIAYTPTLKITCPTKEECLKVPKTIGYIENDKFTFKIIAIINDNEITDLSVPCNAVNQTFLDSIYEKLGINTETIASSEIAETTYYGLINSKPSYLVKINYTCTNNSYDCLYNPAMVMDGSNYIASYIVSYNLNENNEMILESVNASDGYKELVLKTGANSDDYLTYEKSLVREYLIKNELITEDANVDIVPGENGIRISCNSGDNSCTNISTTVLDSKDNFFFLNCTYDIAVTDFNKVYVSFLEF